MFLRLLLTLLVAAADQKPSVKDVQSCVESTDQSAVQVQSKKQKGTGIIVGNEGHILTEFRFSQTAPLLVRWKGQTFPAKVAFADRVTGTALLVPEATSPFPAVAVSSQRAPKPGAWLITVHPLQGAQFKPFVGQVVRTGKVEGTFETDLPFMGGAPVFDGNGRMVGLMVARSRSGAKVSAIAHLRSQVKSGAAE